MLQEGSIPGSRVKTAPGFRLRFEPRFYQSSRLGSLTAQGWAQGCSVRSEARCSAQGLAQGKVQSTNLGFPDLRRKP